jgi:hypothetical protein
MDRPLDLPIYNSYTLNLPAWFATATKNYGNPKDPVWFALANPTTTARNISNRKHEHSIDIARKSITKPELVKSEWDNNFTFKNEGIIVPKDFKKNMIPSHFSELDQKRIEKMKAHPNENFGNYPVLARGRPEEMPKNVEYNRHHKNHDSLQKYGKEFLDKVKEVEVGRLITTRGKKPIWYGGEDRERSVLPSPVSSRTGSSRLSSLASSLRSSVPSDSDSDSDSESDDEDEQQAEKDRQRGIFGRNPLGSSSSGSSRSSRPSVSRGKPSLKRPEPNPKTIAGTTAPKPKPKKTKPAVELVIEETEPKPKRKTKTTKPTPSEAGEEITKKARGRTPKYATKEEAYLAKLEQNKLGKQKKAEAKRLAGTGLRKKKIHGVDYVLEIDESAPIEHFPKEETQEERRFKFEEEQRKKHVEKLTADTEKLREKEEKRLSKVSAKKSKPVKILTEKQIKDKLAREKLKAKKEGIRAEHARISNEKWEKERPEREKREMLEKKASEEYDKKWKKPHELYDKVRRITEEPTGHWTDAGKEFRQLSLTEALMELIPKWKPNKSDTDKLRTFEDFINHGKEKIYPHMPLWRATTKSYAPDYGENTFMGDFFLKWSKTVK